MTEFSTPLDAALAYADHGWHVYPVIPPDADGHCTCHLGARCPHPGKHPLADLAPRGLKNATRDPDLIRYWFGEYLPTANVGVACEPSGLLVLDADDEAGLEWVKQQRLPSGPFQETGSGFWHFLFRLPADRRVKSTTKRDNGLPIDVRACGGAIIVPPSRHASGKRYRWRSDWRKLLPDLPPETLAILPAHGSTECRDEGPRPSPAIVPLVGINPLRGVAGDPAVTFAVAPLPLPRKLDPDGGGRRPVLVRVAGAMLGAGVDVDRVLDEAMNWNARLPHPLTESEVRKHVLGLARLEDAGGNKKNAGAEQGDGELGASSADTSYHREVVELVPAPDPSSSYHHAVAEPVIVGAVHPCHQPQSEELSPVTAEQAVAEVVMTEVVGEEGYVSQPAVPADTPTEPPADGLPPPFDTPACHGLLGEMLAAVAPETEADPWGILLGWLACFGSVVGRGAWAQVGPRSHHPALYVGVVGRTSDEKGGGWAVAVWPFRQADPAWESACVTRGIGSGEGLVELVADPPAGLVPPPPPADKRRLVRLSELSRCFTVSRRDGSSLSEYLREMWDGDPISVPNRGSNALSASDYAVSMVGDITPGVLQRVLSSGTEAFDGSANRMLWCVVRSNRDLPGGGDIRVLDPFVPRLREVLAAARGGGELARDAAAERRWKEVYADLKRSGDAVPHTDRARPQVVRLSLLYALADRSPVIRLSHLEAALAVWGHCRRSCERLFRPDEPAGRVADDFTRVEGVIAAQPGVSQADLWRQVRLEERRRAEVTDWLVLNGRVYSRTEGTGGRPVTRWYPGADPGGAVAG